MHGLQAPAGTLKLQGQPVEQFGMRGLVTRLSEVANAAHDPLAEMVLPDAVDHDPRGQWVIGLSQPSGERQAPASRCGVGPRGLDFKGFGGITQDRGDAGLNQGAGILIVTAAIDVSGGRRTAIP